VFSISSLEEGMGVAELNALTNTTTTTVPTTTRIATGWPLAFECQGWWRRLAVETNVCVARGTEPAHPRAARATAVAQVFSVVPTASIAARHRVGVVWA